MVLRVGGKPGLEADQGLLSLPPGAGCSMLDWSMKRRHLPVLRPAEGDMAVACVILSVSYYSLLILEGRRN